MASSSIWSQTKPKNFDNNAKQSGIEIGNTRVIVFAGHGSWNTVTDANPNDWFTIPNGTYVVFWCLHGQPFAGSQLDTRLGSAQFRPQDFNKHEHNPSSTNRLQLGVHRTLPEILEPGSPCRQYRLTPPDGLSLKNVLGDNRFITVQDRGPQNIGYKLEDLLKLHNDKTLNATVHWAACRVVKAR
jgi:hypothetical protein